jgi:hypothetical protein
MIIRVKDLAYWSMVILMVFPGYVEASKSTLVSMFATGSYVIILALFLALDRKRFLFRGTLIFLPLLMIAIVSSLGLFYDYPFYDVVKDLWYLLNPVLILLCGYILFSHIRDIVSLVHAIVMSSAILALMHLSSFIINPEYLTDNYLNIRGEVSKGVLVVSLALALCVYHFFSSQKIIKLPSVLLGLISIILFVSIVLSFSRTVWLVLFIMLFFLFGFHLLRYWYIKLWVILCGVIIVVLVAWFSNISGAEEKSFAWKLLRSIDEISSDDSDIHKNWRGYESYRAALVYNESMLIQKIFGHGAGYSLDMEVYVKLGGMEYRYIPWLHNGYWYVLLKAGAFGFLFYFIFFWLAWRHTSCNGKVFFTDFASNLSLGIIVTLMITTIITAGAYNKTSLMQFLLALGALSQYFSLYKRKAKVILVNRGNLLT